MTVALNDYACGVLLNEVATHYLETIEPRLEKMKVDGKFDYRAFDES